MTAAQALALRPGDRVRVARAGRRRARLAVVTGAPTAVGRWALVPYAFARLEGDVPVLGRVDHVAQVPTDRLEEARP